MQPCSRWPPLLAAAVLPWGRLAVADLDVGVVWFNAMEVVAWAAVWMVGWGSNSALSLVGGYRFVVQGLAYELPHMFAIITAALAAESLRVSDIVEAQQDLWFVVLMPVGVRRLPASRLRPWRSGGRSTRPCTGTWAGERWPSCPGSTGSCSPVGVGCCWWWRRRWRCRCSSEVAPGRGCPRWLWTVLKTAAVLALLVWMRRRIPTLRMDRWTEIAWVVLIPLTIAQALVVAVVVLQRGGM